MKHLWIVAMSAAMLSSAWALQENTGPQSSTPANAKLKPTSTQLSGTQLVAELTQSLNSTKVKPGGVVKATLTQDVIAHGRVAIARGSKLVGHVTEIKVRTKQDQESRLGVVFDKAILKGGEEINFTAAILALAAPVRNESLDQQDPMSPMNDGNVNGGRIGNAADPQPIGSARSMNNNTGPGFKNGNAPVGRAGDMQTQSTPSRSEPGRSEPGRSEPGRSEPSYGMLSGGSRGVFGLPGLQLSSNTGSQNATVITSTRQNVKLDSGTQMVIEVK